jgi:hypothetical protein
VDLATILNALRSIRPRERADGPDTATLIQTPLPSSTSN